MADRTPGCRLVVVSRVLRFGPDRRVRATPNVSFEVGAYGDACDRHGDAVSVDDTHRRLDGEALS
jgi:hypothetical protein